MNKDKDKVLASAPAFISILSATYTPATVKNPHTQGPEFNFWNLYFFKKDKNKKDTYGSICL